VSGTTQKPGVRCASQKEEVHRAFSDPDFYCRCGRCDDAGPRSKHCFEAIEPKPQPLYDCLDAKQKKASDTGGRIGGIFDWLGRR